MSGAQAFDSSQSAQSFVAAPGRLRGEALSPVLVRGVAGLALAALFLTHLGLMTFVDPDLWHEMATAREFWRRGTMPLIDTFAYTPTVEPVVHHEWGTGAVLYVVSSLGGAAAMMVVKYALTFGTAAFCFAAARRRGASWEVILSLAPLTILAGIIGFTTIRAQLFTLFFTAWLMYDLAGDQCDAAAVAADDARSAKRRRVHRLWKWLPLYVAWLNLHAGFVVGVGLAALYTVEAVVRRRPSRHLWLAGIAAAALVVINPYGLSYCRYLLHGLTMPRPLVTEWQPLWTAEPTMFQMYLASLLVTAYAVLKLGVRRAPGLALIAVTAYLAAQHTRHVSIYFVVWLSLVPAYVQPIGLGRAIVDAWNRRRLAVALGAALVAGFGFVQAAEREPWRLVVPATSADERIGRPVYPVGAVAYLRDIRFVGNLFTPFVPGGYCLFQLEPAVKVSLDGRYEVAYRHGVLEENVDFYAARAGWRTTLGKYPTEAILAPQSAPVTAELRRELGWCEAYADEVYVVFGRADLPWPAASRPAPPPSFP